MNISTNTFYDIYNWIYKDIKMSSKVKNEEKKPLLNADSDDDSKAASGKKGPQSMTDYY